MNRTFEAIGIWALWVMVSSVGACTALGITVGVFRIPGLNQDRWVFPIFISLLGFLLGLCQGLVISRLVRHWWLWTAFSLSGAIVALALALGLTAVVAGRAISGYTSAMVFTLFGGVLGFAQWVVLGRCVPSAGWWIVASIAGWAVLGFGARGALTSVRQTMLIGPIPASASGILVALWWSGKGEMCR